LACCLLSDQLRQQRQQREIRFLFSFQALAVAPGAEWQAVDVVLRATQIVSKLADRPALAICARELAESYNVNVSSDGGLICLSHRFAR
jgi:hypothetical protein